MNSAMRTAVRPRPARRARRLVAAQRLASPGRARAGTSRPPETSPCARAWTRMLPSAVASTGPATTGSAAGVGGQLAQQRVPRAAADEVDDLDRPRPVSRAASRDRPRVRGGEAVEDAAHERRAGPAGPARPVASHASAIRAGMSPGREERRVVRVDDRAAGRQRRGRLEQRARGRSGVPARSHVRSDSWSSHRPMTLRRYRVVPSTPPSFVKFAAAARLAEDRLVAARRPTSDQVPHEMYANALARRPGRRRPPRRCRASRRA